MEKEYKQGNLFGAIIVTIIAGLSCAIIIGLIGSELEAKSVWLDIIIGLIVGLAVRFVGKGVSLSFAFAAAIVSLMSCIISDYISLLWSDYYYPTSFLGFICWATAVIVAWNCARNKEYKERIVLHAEDGIEYKDE